MKVVIDRDLCNATLPYGQRCSAAFIRFPEGKDRLCIRKVVEDGQKQLTVELHSDGRVVSATLTDELRAVASVEGWEALINFHPAPRRTGANRRWQALSRLPLNS